ncbi:MAG: ribosome maturation factor RimM, partial [candidate division Zixibacteria bacterium]
MADDEEFVTVGRLGRPWGVKGEIFVTPLTDFPERFVNIEEIFVSSKNDWEKKKVVSSKFISGRPVLLFENINSPEQASRLTNRYLAIPKNMVRQLPEGSNYIYDLIDCQVIDE